jgi:hypothetical protein
MDCGVAKDVAGAGNGFQSVYLERVRVNESAG